MNEDTRQLSERIDGLAETIGKTNGELGKVGQTVERLKALLEAHLDRTSDERKVLFRVADEHRDRIAAIERDYVTHTLLREYKADFDRQVVESRVGLAKQIEELKTQQLGFNDAITVLKTQMAKIFVLGAIGSVALSGLAQYVVKLLTKG